MRWLFVVLARRSQLAARVCNPEPTQIQPFSSNQRETSPKLLSPAFAQHRVQHRSDHMDRALFTMGPEHPLGFILRKRDRGLDRIGRDGNSDQVHVRDRLGGKPQAAASLSKTVVRVLRRALAERFPVGHRNHLGALVRALQSQLEVGAGGRQHRFRVDADLRPIDHDQAPGGEPFQGQ